MSQGDDSPGAVTPGAVPLGATLSDVDARRRSDLRRMKVLATALLFVAALIFALSRHTGGPLGFVNAAAEAAMVGAIADWFAVTALFRRPLGLPVPHTAIIPTRKDALGRSLQEFVSTNFLATDVVRERVGRVGVARRAGLWLAEPAHAARVDAELASLARGALRVLRDEQVVAVIDEVLLRRVLQRPWGPPAGRVLGRVVADGAHHKLVDVAVDAVHGWIEEHEEAVVALILDRAPAWTPVWVDVRVARRAYTEALRLVSEVQADQDHRVRLALDDVMARLAKDLQHDERAMAHADALRERLLAHPEVLDGVEALWKTIREVLVEAVDDPGSDVRRRVTDAVLALGHRLAEDPTLRSTVDGYVVDAVGHIVSTYRDEVATVISETVQRWDATEASRRIELHVGRDLQFIRINGTVVGGLAGLLIHAVTVLAG